MPAIDAANGGMLAGSHFRVNKAIVGYPSWQRWSLLCRMNFAELGLSKSSVKDASQGRFVGLVPVRPLLP
jgi:hypothetical protein